MNHSICLACWRKFHGWEREPVRLIEGRQEVCCFCSHETSAGIYVRGPVKALVGSHMAPVMEAPWEPDYCPLSHR